MILGDWGNPIKTDGNGQEKTANAMIHVSEAVNIDFVISVGDNFYVGDKYDYDGVLSTNDEKWETLWKNIYGNEITNKPWYSVLGNHDWYGRPEAQIEYGKININWNLKSYFWSMTKKIGNETAAFIFLDTNLLANGYQGDRPKMSENFKRVGWTAENRTIEKQLRWIHLNLLKYQKSDYIFVIGHHPLGTCPEQETNDMKNVKLMLEKYRITAYFFGHHHTMQYTEENGIAYIQTGAGGKNETTCIGKNGWGINNEHGYVVASIKKGYFKARFIDDKKKVRGIFSKASRKY